ncbi:saccharopine dehydrogenase [Nocardia sp. NPDC057663]|uniref:saccharopine dehydrogenase n=1 Tax=Nocardia sp. NPDC057663 TaxID=3346201 RepID=UPI00366E86EF
MSDVLELDSDGPVLLVGGYGTVGAEVARLAASEFPIMLTGRSIERGRTLADELGAGLRVWDLGSPDGFRARVRAVVGLVNDPDDRVLRAAVTAGIPYVDITRWTARVQRAVTVTALLDPRAPVVLSSSWMGGVVGLVAANLAAELGGMDTAEVAIRWDLRDRAGADSVEFMDRLGLDYEVVRDGQRHMVMPLSAVERVVIGGHRTKVALIDTPEQFTFPLTLGATTAATRIGFSSAAATSALLAAKHLGVFRWGRGDRYIGMRRALLYSPGEGGTANVRVDVGHGGESRTATVTDRAGQAHLTAVGALAALRRALGADGGPTHSGVNFPEQTPAPASVPAFLAAHGVDLTISGHTGARTA